MHRHASQAKFTSAETVCALCGQPSQVSACIAVTAGLANLILTYYGVDTNSGEVIKAHRLLLLTSVLFLTNNSL